VGKWLSRKQKLIVKNAEFGVFGHKKIKGNAQFVSQKKKRKKLRKMNNLKSITEWQKKGIGELVGMYLKSGWIFESAWEKLILVGLCGLGFLKILGWIL